MKFHHNVKLILRLKPLLRLFSFSFSFFFGVEIFENILRKKEEARFGTEFTRFRRLALAGHQITELDFLRIVVTNPKRCPDN